MGMFDWFTKAKDEAAKKKAEQDAKDKDERAKQGEANYRKSKSKPEGEGWVALDE